MIGEGFRSARNSEKRQTGSVEDQDGATQTVNERIAIERQQPRMLAKQRHIANR